MKSNIFLVGPTGAGKTTIGRMLSEHLGLVFYDSDKEIEVRTGVTVSTIFEYEGEQGFREREEMIIDELSARSGVILATGGGAILNEDTCRRLISRGNVVYLNVSVQEQLRRTRGDRNRPLLQDDIEKTLRKMALERTPIYKRIADYEFRTDNRSSKKLALTIVKTLRRFGGYGERSNS